MRRKDHLVIWKKKRNGITNWFWHLRNAYNAKIVCDGEPNGFSSRSKALGGWKSTVKAAGGTGIGNVEVVDL